MFACFWRGEVIFSRGSPCAHSSTSGRTGNTMLLRLAALLPLVANLAVAGVFVSNLDATCMRCLCVAATSCDMLSGCQRGYCGPFYISRVYWADAGKPVLPEDEPQRDGAYQDCAVDYNCAKGLVENYMAKHGRDCNGDGITNCDDYAMIHYHGAKGCERPIEGTKFYNRYLSCRPPSAEESSAVIR